MPVYVKNTFGRAGATATASIRITNSEGSPVPPASLGLIVLGPDENELLNYAEGSPPLPGSPVVASPRLRSPAVGTYDILWGDPYPWGAVDPDAPTADETRDAERRAAQESCLGDYLFLWTVEGNLFIQKMRVVMPRVLGIIPDLRLYLDRALKPHSQDLSTDPRFVGYDDFMLLEFAIGGLELINGFQPTVRWGYLHDFPYLYHGALLRDAAVYYGLMSQQLFAIDTDVSSWSDSGNSWVLDHYPKLAQVSQAIYAALEKRVPPMKMQFVGKGSVRSTVTAGYRLNVLVESAPSGALFRNTISS